MPVLKVGILPSTLVQWSVKEYCELNLNYKPRSSQTLPQILARFIAISFLFHLLSLSIKISIFRTLKKNHRLLRRGCVEKE